MFNPFYLSESNIIYSSNLDLTQSNLIYNSVNMLKYVNRHQQAHFKI